MSANEATMKNPQANSEASTTPAQSVELMLRFFDGLHAGAERALGDNETVVIGCADDCDVILGDAGVAIHHCYLGVHHGVMTLRAMDAPIKVDGEPVRPGSPITLKPFKRVQVGEATFVAGPRWSKRWREVVAAEESAGATPADPRNTSLLWAIGLLLCGVLAIALGWYWIERPDGPSLIDAEQTRLVTLLDKLKLHDVSVGPFGDGRLQVFGIVETPQQADQLRTALEHDGLSDVRFAVRDGPSLARDLDQLLAMSNPSVDAETRWLGDKTILVTGHFGNGDALAHALSSKSVHDFNEGFDLKVKQQNLDQAGPGFRTSEPGKKITSVVHGEVPYLVTADQSTYYVGSKLPQGGVFKALDGDDIVVEYSSGATRRYATSEVAPGASIVSQPTEAKDEHQ